jgi:hypothetical protein
MGKTRPVYLPGFRRQIVELVLSGGTPEEPAREFEPSAHLPHAHRGALRGLRRH